MGLIAHAEKNDRAKRDDAESPENDRMHEAGLEIPPEHFGLSKGDHEKVSETRFDVLETVIGLTSADDLPPAKTGIGKAGDGCDQ